MISNDMVLTLKYQFQWHFKSIEPTEIKMVQITV